MTESSGPRRETVGRLREWAQEVLNWVHIENIRLKRLTITSSDVVMEGPFRVTTEMSFSGLRGADQTYVETSVSYRLTARTGTDDDSEGVEVWSANFELTALFRGNEDDPLRDFTQDQLDAFALVVGVMHVHPYARETAQSITARTGYPPFTLDGLLPVSAQPDDFAIEFGSAEPPAP